MIKKNFILEKNQRFSQSLLWDLQDRAYQDFGIDAWASKGVPFYLTSCPLLAKLYGELVLNYIKDILEDIVPGSPLYLFDLGAGTGRFGFLFLKYLLPHIKSFFFWGELVSVMS